MTSDLLIEYFFNSQSDYTYTINELGIKFVLFL